MIKEGERLDDLQLKGLKIIQNPKWFCFGIDAVLLADFAKTRRKDKVADLGTGNGIIPLLMYGRYEPVHITGVEIQSEVVEMARRSIKLNNLEDRIDIFEGDIKSCYKELDAGRFDVVVSNPPYKKADTGLLSPLDQKAISRSEVLIDIDSLARSAYMLLKNGGRFCMIHRPERLKDIILALEKNRFNPKRIRFVQPNYDKAPTMVLVEAAKNGGDYLKVETPLYVYNTDGTYSDEINTIYGR